jgi:hypothetical protein
LRAQEYADGLAVLNSLYPPKSRQLTPADPQGNGLLVSEDSSGADLAALARRPPAGHA